MAHQHKLYLHIVSDNYRVHKISQGLEGKHDGRVLVFDVADEKVAGDEELVRRFYPAGDEKPSRQYFAMVSCFGRAILSPDVKAIIVKGVEGEDLEDFADAILDSLYRIQPEIHFITMDDKSLPLDLKQLCEVTRYPASTREERREIFAEARIPNIEEAVEATEGMTLSEAAVVANLMRRGYSLIDAIIDVKAEKLSAFGIEVQREHPYRFSALDTVNAAFRRRILQLLDGHRRLSIMLVGLPGQGKTFAAKAILAERPGLNLLLNASKLIEALSYRAERRLRLAPDQLIFDAIEWLKPSGILIDQFDFLSARYGLEHVAIMDKLLTWLERREHGILIATTVKPEDIDPQLMRPGRFNYVILMPLPDYNTRKNILRLYGIDPARAGILASRFAGYLPADFENIAKYDSVKPNPRYVEEIRARYRQLYEFVTRLPHGIAFDTPAREYRGL
jgi:SpoVK/Ycf46/Vps4 family AAA+-type ATPase